MSKLKKIILLSVFCTLSFLIVYLLFDLHTHKLDADDIKSMHANYVHTFGVHGIIAILMEAHPESERKDAGFDYILYIYSRSIFGTRYALYTEIPIYSLSISQRLAMPLGAFSHKNWRILLEQNGDSFAITSLSCRLPRMEQVITILITPIFLFRFVNYIAGRNKYE